MGLLRLDAAARRVLLGLPPRINRDDLEKRVLDGGATHRHERELIAGLLRGKKQNPRHRPPSPEVALKEDEVAQFVVYYEALHPGVKREAAVAAAMEFFCVARSSVFRAIDKLDPERAENMKRSAVAFANWVSAQSHEVKT